MEQDYTSAYVLSSTDLGELFSALTRRDYTIIGPTIRDGAVHYRPIDSVEELPTGWRDEQGPGSCRLVEDDRGLHFGCTLAAESWKRYLHPPKSTLFVANGGRHGFEFEATEPDVPRYAFLGVRPCELRAIEIQDRVLRTSAHADPYYAAVRDNALIVAVSCIRAGENCFCRSMNTGPKATGGFDLALTEVADSTGHFFLVETGSDEGVSICGELPVRDADRKSVAAAEAAVQAAAGQMKKHLDTDDLPALLGRNLDHPRWDEIANRCLSCGNCTLVCPTCFCTAVEDRTEPGTQRAERLRVWDSCFNSRFSYIHGGSVRQSIGSRYRQWMTHKLSTWHDQFGTSGCVGCGRCVTWCPVGIDITEEAAAIRAADRGAGS